MRLAPLLTTTLLLATPFTRAQQANVNLDWDPHRDAEGLRPFSAGYAEPMVMVVRNNRHLLHERFLPNLWRNQ